MAPEDAFDTLTPLYRLLNCFSLVSVTRENKNLKVSYSNLKSIIVISISFIVIAVVTAFKAINYKILYNVVTNKTLKFTDSIQLTYLVLFVHFIVGLHCVHKYGRDMTLKYFRVYDQIDKILGMAYYIVIKSKIAWITAYVSSLITLISTLDFIAWLVTFGWHIPTLYCIEYVLFFINTLITIEAISNIIQIEYRLFTIGDILQDFYSSSANTTSVLEDVIGDKNWLYSTKKSKLRKKKMSKILDYNNYYDIIWMNKCYLLLLEQTEFINRVFGFRILINNIYLLWSMVNSVNIAVRIMNGIIEPIYSDYWYFPVVTSMLRMLFCVSVMVGLVHHCELCYNQGAKIISIIDHILVDKNINTSIRNVLSETRNLVVTRPVTFSTKNFYKLNYALLDCITSVVVTLSVILLQNMN